METAELISYGFENNRLIAEEKWIYSINSSARFRNFVYEHRDKIRKKIREANSAKEDIVDVLAELEMAYLLLQIDRFTDVAYELYGKDEPNPDLKVTNKPPEKDFNVEVKRIRMTDLERGFDAWRRDICQQVEAVPSGLGFSMTIHNSDESKEFVDQLEEKKTDILLRIKKTIEVAKRDIPAGTHKQYAVPGFEGKVTFQPSNETEGLPANRTVPFGEVFPVFGTAKEHTKFGDIICNPRNLNQMRPGEINILAITTDSGIDSISDRLNQAMRSITSQDDKFFEKHGFKDAIDFYEKFHRVSGVLFRSTWVGDGCRNPLWINTTAESAIPQDVANALQDMEYPKDFGFDPLIRIRR